ncbi:MAG: hypothetical protein Kow0062_12690 [Acidobacteriota bacterium]
MKAIPDIGRGALLVAILLAGLAVRLVGLSDPLAVRPGTAWREADYLAIARAFDREGLDPFHPRIDWRGDGPGYVESEFPVFPWLVAIAIRAGADPGPAARTLGLLASLAGLLLFCVIARERLRGPGFLSAVAVFALHPTLAMLGNGFQPDVLLVPLTLASMLLLARWLRGGHGRQLVAAGALLGAAVLIKASAACLGLAFAWACLARLGRRAFVRPAPWLAAALALAPGAAWYAWAHRFWSTWGHSLGISNETHLIGLAPAALVRGLKGLVRQLLGWGFAVGTLPFVVIGIARRTPEDRLPEAWLLSVLAFDLLALRTTGDAWAFYYHAMIVPPVALLAGHGLEELARWLETARLRRALLTAAILVAVVPCALLSWSALGGRLDGGSLVRQRACAQELAAMIPPHDLIAVRGAPATDDEGNPVAWDESPLFAFLDRRGFTFPAGEWSVDTLARLAERGARWHVIPRRVLARHPETAAAIAARWPDRSPCRELAAFDLR